MLAPTEDLRIAELRPMPAPADVIREIPRDAAATDTTLGGRAAIREILSGRDRRLLVVVGPCSIHDPEAARDYATRLAAERFDELNDTAHFGEGCHLQHVGIVEI